MLSRWQVTCPVHDFDGYTCPVKPCKYEGLSGDELQAAVQDALQAERNLEEGLIALYGERCEK